MYIFLIGPRGSGKSRVGGHLARRLGLPLRDTDDIVREKAGCGIAEFVAREGWPAFRALESAALSESAGYAADSGTALTGEVKAAAIVGDEKEPAGAVVSTGGGVVLAPENRERMRRSGLVFYLEVPVEELGRRLSRGRALVDRPSLTGQDPLREIAAVLAEREPLYREAAHHVVRADRRPEAVARAIARIVKQHADVTS